VFDVEATIKEIINNLSKQFNLRKPDREKLKKIVLEDYRKRFVHYGEAVGQVSAQSMGEPGTQMTLRTKHRAGAKEFSIGSGIQRAKEIVDARKTIKYPSMVIHLKGELARDERKARKFANNLLEIRVRDIANIKENFEEKKVEIVFSKDAIKERWLRIEEVIDKVAEKIKGRVRKNFDKGTIRIHYNDKFSLLKIRKEVNRIKNTKLQGIKNIEGVLVVKEGNEYVIKTRGTNLKAILKLEDIDETKTISNDMFEIYAAFGIEAARNAIIKELSRVYGEEVTVDIRHVLLLADTMTFTGEIKGIARTGINKLKHSPLARAAFEETIKHLMEAAFLNEEERIRGVVANIIVGQPIKIGTGRIKLMMKG